MSQTYFPGETYTALLQVLRLNNTVPSFPGDYTTPQVRIVHEDSGLVTDVAPVNMAQLDDNLWFYEFVIPPSPFFGDYIVEFNATIDGNDSESSETLKVSPPSDIVEQGQGSCEITDTVLNEATTNPIPGVDVFAFDPGDLENALAHDVTDLNGSWTLFLNPGSYKIRFVKIGYMNETHDITVDVGCTFNIVGD